MGENKTTIISVLMKIQHRRFIQNVKAIPGEYQHSLVVADIDKKKVRNVFRKTCIDR